MSSSRSRTSQRPPRRSRGARFLRTFLLLILLGAVAVLATGAGFYVAVARNVPSLEAHGEFAAAQTTKIYDSADPPQLLADLHGIENRVVVDGSEIPQHMRDAVVAVEDRRFYTHQGVDFFGIVRALIADIREREIVQGGSTITQQFVKNAYISSEQTLDRKVREAVLAYQLEQRWSKEKILNEYLNTVYFGEGAYGIEAAAQEYFGVPAIELHAAEAALLAGIPKSPTRFSPRRNPEVALERRDMILNKMFQQGYLTGSALQEALSRPLGLVAASGEAESEVPYWIELVREQLVAKYGSNTVLEGGLRVYTSVDLVKQRFAEEAISSILDQPGDPEAALVSIDLRTGRLVAMVGGSDFEEQKFNVAVQGRRQPGSAFKPFVLLTALEEGMTPHTVYESGPVTIDLPGDDWDVGSPELGPITLREATVRSINGTYARLMMDVGPEDVVETAHRLGIDSELQPHPAIALGGLSEGVSPLEMAVAYGTLGTGGTRLSGDVVFDPDEPRFPISIVRVETSEGTVLDENELVRTRALDPQIAYLTTDILKGVIQTGTGRAADIGRPAAGKTGTTQEYRDAWFVGYTPELVTAVWVGYPNEQKEMTNVHGRRVTGGSFPAQIWARYMENALEGTEPTDFPVPSDADWVTVTIDPETGFLATEWCPTSVEARFLQGREPTEDCPVHEPEELALPDVTEMLLEDARALLEEQKFEVDVVEKVTVLQPSGIVVSQDPPAGTMYMQGSTVTLTVTSGTAPAGTVPAVVGLERESAQEILNAAGYVPELKEILSDQPAGIVVSQSPSAGSRLSSGQAVLVEVSAGASVSSTTTTASSAVVPDVVDMRLATAEERLRNAGLEAEVVERIPAEDPSVDGRVVTQSPAAGDEVSPGTTVELTIYEAP